MKKAFIFLMLIIGFGIITNAQDIILKKDGSEIKAKVLEITDQQIKYKDFDFQSGPIRNINISEVFLVTYENGQREVFTKLNESNASSPKRQSVTNCAKKTALGLDIGLGGSFYTILNEKSPSSFAPALGIRVMHHFNPYFGVDFLRVNWITDLFTSGLDDGWTMRLQIMPGIRGNSPTFFKCMSVYSAFRLGYGMDFRLLTVSGASHFEGLSLETELGLNLTPTVFAGFTYNYHKYFVKGVDSKLAIHTLSFRLGFNLGKKQEGKAKRVTSDEMWLIRAKAAAKKTAEPNGYLDFHEYKNATPSLDFNFALKGNNVGINYAISKVTPKSDRYNLKHDIWGIRVNGIDYINSGAEGYWDYNKIEGKGYYSYFRKEGFFGKEIPCVILPTGKILELTPELLIELCKDNEDIIELIQKTTFKKRDASNTLEILRKYNLTKE